MNRYIDRIISCVPVVIFILLLISCKSKHDTGISTQVKKQGDFFEVDYEELLHEEKVISLTQIASDVEYIVLETNRNCIIGRSPEFFFTDNHIFVSNWDHILKYSRSGKFLGQIGKPGRGPGEIDYIRTMSILADEELVVVHKTTKNELLYFTFEGNLVKTVPVPRCDNLKVLKDDEYLVYEDGGNGYEQYNFLLINEKGDTLSYVENNDKWEKTINLEISFDYTYFKPFFWYKDDYYFKTMYNDTIYSVSDKEIKPEYFVNLGSYKLPDELRAEKIFADKNMMESFRNVRDKCYYCITLNAADKIFLSTYTFQEGKDTKYSMFDIKDNSGYLLVNDNRVSTGIVNNWDRGLDFWPTGRINENQVFMPVSVLDIKKALDVDIKNVDSYVIEERDELIKLMSGLDETSNPLIMLVNFKNKI